MHIGKHPSRCFHSEIHSAVSAHGDSQLERDIAVDKTETMDFGESKDVHRFPSVQDGNR